MRDIDLGSLEHGPHANLIRDMASKCFADAGIQAIWVGGSLATGLGDAYSDVDFRIAVEPGQIARWTSPDWEQYLPIRPCGGVLMRFGEQALLHHLVLADGTIVDFYVQDTTQQNSEPKLVHSNACRPNSSASCLKTCKPRTELPFSSSRGEKVPMPSCRLTAPTIPPPTPLLQGTPTSSTQLPE